MPGRQAAGPKPVAAKPVGSAPPSPRAPDPSAVSFALGAPRVQRLAADGATGEAPAAPYGTIVEDETVSGPGQIARTAFLDQTLSAIEAAAQEELAKVHHTVEDCPYLVHWLQFYRGKPAARIERAIERYASPAATDPESLIAAVVARAQGALTLWAASGTVDAPPNVAWMGDRDGLEEGPPPPGPVLGFGGGTASRSDPRAIQARLGTGAPLDAGTRARMERGFNRSFSDVRLHTGGVAARLARGLSARAFAVGQHVAFGESQFRPGTLAGDAVLAHELAHTAQQSGGATGSERALEADANEAAARALTRGRSLPADATDRVAEVARALPAETGAKDPTGADGLSIHRCSSATAPSTPLYDYDSVMKTLGDAYTRKQGILTGTTPESESEELDARIDAEIEKLREIGVKVSRDDILAAVADKRDLRKVGGRIAQVPSDDLFPGERALFQFVPDYIPAGGLLEFEWTWTIGSRHAQFAQAPNRTRTDHIQLGEGWWYTEESNIEAAGGFEIQANVYVGSNKTPVTTASTGLVKVTQPLPEKLTIAPNLEKIVVGSTVDFWIAEWAENRFRSAVDWSVDGVAQPRLPKLRYTFNALGDHKIVATISRGKTRDEAVPVRTVPLEVTVESMEQAGGAVLSVMTASKLPALGEVRASMDTALASIDKRVSEGGEQKPYWEKARKLQTGRRESLDEFSKDFSGAAPLPADAASAAPSTYATPLPAVLVLPRALGVQPLSMHMLVRHDGQQWLVRLIDSTGELLKYDGSGSTLVTAAQDAFGTWRKNNPYPMGGRVLYTFAPAGWTLGDSFGTTTTGKRVESWIDTVLTVGAVIVAGLLLMGGGVPLALGLIMAAMTIGRSLYAIHKNLDLGIPITDRRNVLEGLAIITSFMGIGGSALRQVGIRAARPILYRVGSWTVMATIAADAGTLVYASNEALDSLKTIDADPTMDESTRASRAFGLVAALIAQGGMFILSNKDLFKGGLKRSDFFPTDPKATAASAAGTANPTLETGARLDMAVELKKAGDSAASLAPDKLSNRDLVDRYMALPWMQEGLSLAEIKALLPRLSTDALVKLRDLEPKQAKALVDDIGSDAVVNKLAPKLGGQELRTRYDQVAALMRKNAALDNVLRKRPEVLGSLLDQPEAVEVVRQAVENVEAARTGGSRPTPLSRAQMTTPLTPQQRATSSRVAADVPPGKNVQDGFDQRRKGDTQYRDEYLDRLYKDAELAQSELTKLAERVAAATNGQAGSRPEPKNRQRSLDKIASDYKGDASRLTDLAGSKIVYKSLDDLYRGLERVKSEAGGQIVSFKDRFITPEGSGYRDIQMTMKMSNGHVSEFRLHLESVERVAGYEHAVYETQRSIAPLAQEAMRPVTPAEDTLIDALQAESQKRYNQAVSGSSSGGSSTP